MPNAGHEHFMSIFRYNKKISDNNSSTKIMDNNSSTKKLDKHNYIHIPIMTTEERIKYYMGKWYDKKIVITDSRKYERNKISCDTILLINRDRLNNNSLCNYCTNLIKNIDISNNRNFLFTFGDHIHRNVQLPILCKVTDLSHSHIITKLNHRRHWGEIHAIPSKDIPYTQKINNIVWRGATTGYKHLRKLVVDKYHNHPHFNIGFNYVCSGSTLSFPLKNTISIGEQLTYKFILSIEGNDVATGLKWQLYSNSVVIMAKPTCVSWLMEDKLIPYVHYLPVKDDYSDLDIIYNWALAHEAECIAIAKASTNFIEQFLDENREDEIHKGILKQYFDNIKFVL
jgi:hypothetical protein